VSLVGNSFTPAIVKALNAATAVTVADAGLVQRKDTVVVYFNQDALNPASAQNPAFYRLYDTGGTLTTADDLLLHPAAVTYDLASNSAVLKFASDLPTAIYSLRIGSDTESTELLSSAIDLGELTTSVPVQWNGVIGDSNAGANDVDFYKFVLTASQSVSFTATPVAGADLALRLFNSAGIQQGIRNAGGVGAAETLVSGVLGAGTYFLGVSSSGNVTYNPVTGAGASGGTTTGAYKLTSGSILISDDNSSFATANKVGVLGATQLTIDAQIEPQGIPLPPYPGGIDEPSHREIPISSENHVGSSGTTPAVPGAIGVVNYYFGDVYGQDPFGNVLHNAITEPQKLLARQIMELWSKQAGFVARETTNSGLQIVTGDLRAVSPTIPPNAAAGIAGGGKAIVNGNADYGASEYGGAWFNIAIHEIGHALGLPHAYDAVSVMGSAGGEDSTSTAPGREPIYPTGVDIVNIQRIIPPNATDIDLYQFTLTEAGVFSAETVAERVASNLDSVLRLYDGNRNLIAQNDNYYSSDAFIGLHLQPGTYYIGVSSTGNADYDPAISDTGFGGTTDGAYQLKLNFDPVATSVMVDATGTEFDGNADGEAGGEYEFWFRSANTIVVDKNVAGVGSGTIGAPYSKISDAISAAALTPGSIIRVVGNGGADGNDLTAADAKPYLVGTALSGSTQMTLGDGATLEVPKDTTLMIDAGAVIKLMSANIDAGTSAVGTDRSNGAIQILGTPGRPVYLTSFLDDSRGGDSDGVTDPKDLKGGNWGGVVFRDTSDYESEGIFLNNVNKAHIKYGGGLVSVNSVTTVYTPIHLDTARPTITFNTITNSAAAAVSANPNSFDDSLNRIGPDIHGNLLTNNSINGLNVRIRTLLGKPIDTLDVNARFDDTDIVHVISENLIITGSAGGPLNGVPRLSGRLAIDPGTIVKLQRSRIENQIGNANVIAEGTVERPIVFTSLLDDQYGVGGTFDTTNNGSLAIATPGSWGGVFLGPTSNGSIDHAILRYGGGSTPIEGDSNEFSVIEVHQAAFRLTNSRLEFNAGGVGPDGLDVSRNGRGANSQATVFVRGAQPTIVGNQFRNNSSQGSFLISIDVNSLNSFEHPDAGRSTGRIERFSEFDDNLGALIRNNLMQNNGINGMEVRGGTLETQVVWDDTDIVHVLRDEIYDPNLQTYGGIRLQSSKTASLVVKLEGATAGFTAGGTPLEIDDRIGGTVQIVGTPGFPVVLTSLYDDSVGAGFDLNGFPVMDTNNDGIDLHNNANPMVLTPDGLDDRTGAAFTGTYAGPGDWRSIKLTQSSNDRNVRIVNESEAALSAGQDTNRNPLAAELLGTLAPNDKRCDDNRPVGFEVHGHISPDTPTDVDTYSFKADAGTEVWIDLDRTSSHLDSVLELVLSTGAVIARSDNGVLSGLALSLQKDRALGGDYYTQNHFDEGLRVVLPGTAGVEGTYFVRVRSKGGLTSGAYQLQVRVNQRDDLPGSTVRYADIRFATNGIEMYGLPAHSPLTGEASEANQTNDVNNSFGGSEFIGNLLASDRNTISVSGNLQSATDVDFFTFQVDYQFIQAIAGVNNGGKSWATIFDIDYADGLSRPDTILSVYDESGNLLFVSRDSDVVDDQPAPGAGQNVNDLSRGTVGKLDPFLGTVALPEGDGKTYYVAVSSNGRMPAELNQTFIANPADPLARLEPVNSLRRIVEDHIGLQGYSTVITSAGATPSFPRVLPDLTSGLFDITNATTLSTTVKPFTLADVSLYSATGGSNSLSIRNAFTGGAVVNGIGGSDFNDIAMRPDGVLFGTFANSGSTARIDPLTGAQSGGGASGIPMATGTPDFGGMAFRRTPEVTTGNYELFVANNSDWDQNGNAADGNEAGPALWRLNPDTGALIDEDTSTLATGNQPVGTLPAGAIITGLAFDAPNGSTLFAVDSVGRIWKTTVGGTQASRSIPTVGAWAQVPITGGTGPAGFSGLTPGPQNVQNGAYSQMLFASGADGRLYAFNQAGVLQSIFDTNNDGVADSTSAAYQTGTRGLAFSQLDFNLWHPTLKRTDDAGHGINEAPDNSRLPDRIYRTINGNLKNESEGGASFYFGLEQ
ncbi:MAG: DVUA0089 family protein, partial [Planctomycetaceae bacterium]|nr:DVUA0089 family protein [Planctomycetaceae bacterium]